MDNRKDNVYYTGKIITDLRFILSKTDGLSKEELEKDEVLTDSVMFRLIQISENSEKLTPEFKQNHPAIPWRAIRGLRNRIVHEYGHVDLGIIYDTVFNDLPVLLDLMENEI